MGLRKIRASKKLWKKKNVKSTGNPSCNGNLGEGGTERAKERKWLEEGFGSSRQAAGRRFCTPGARGLRMAGVCGVEFLTDAVTMAPREVCRSQLAGYKKEGQPLKGRKNFREVQKSYNKYI